MIPTEWPQRVACLSSDSVEILYALGQQHRIVGITAFARHPVGVTQNHPIISGFSCAKIYKIVDVKPDLVLAFSDLQRDIVQECAQAGLEVHLFNPRSLADIFRSIDTLGRLLNCSAQATQIIAQLQQQIELIRQSAAQLSYRPRVYFEEWHDPMISAIHWVSELIEIAGGQDVFAMLAPLHSAKARVIQPEQVIAAQPELIIGSWCGQPFKPDQVRERKGWHNIPAVTNGHLFDIDSADLLIPSLAAIMQGLPKLHQMIQQVSHYHANPTSV
jgi:iron complex transport system substrate-binding protein